MIDLLETDLSAAEIAAKLKQIKLIRPMPPMDAPQWIEAAQKPVVHAWMEPLYARAGKEAFGPMPPLTEELYAHFFKTGERLSFETVYFERRRQLGRVAMAVLLGDSTVRSRFTPVLVRRIQETMDEESWTFPAHAWTQPTGKDPFKIDLFAAETANIMGELLNIFGSILPADLQQRIRARLREQCFENYLRPRSEITWKQLPMNWNAVCHQGVIGAALALEDDTELLAALLASSAQCLRIFLSGFGADGSTSEGPGYWSYGFGRFAELNQQLETATGGAFSYFGNNDHIRRIAEFAPAMVFSNGYLINFSDGGSRGRLPSSLLAYLGERLALPLLKQQSASLFKIEAEEGIYLDAQRCDLFSLTRFFLRCPATLKKTDEPTRPDTLFPDYGAVVASGRDERNNFWEFAAKGGHNAEHHNHNDCGSFILHINGEPALVEIGAPEYVHKYFASDATRYTYLAARSLGHSVPLVNGCEQAPGADFAASVLECQLKADVVKFVIDLTKCYPPSAKCSKLVRTLIFDKKLGSLQLSDEFVLEQPGEVRSILITKSPVKTAGDSVRIESTGGVLKITPRENTEFVSLELCEYKDRDGKDASVNRLTFGTGRPARTGLIGCDIRLLA